MKYTAEEMEKAAVLQTAQRMCAAVRTAPKARGIDHLDSCVVTEETLITLAEEMERMGSQREGYEFFIRDAQNVRESQAVVLVGASYHTRGLNEGCGLCKQGNCAQCIKNNSVCVFDPIDLGIAIGSAVSVAANDRVDNRVMFSVGQAAKSLGLMAENVQMIMGIPLSVSKKSPYFDRKFQK